MEPSKLHRCSRCASTCFIDVRPDELWKYCPICTQEVTDDDFRTMVASISNELDNLPVRHRKSA